MWHSSIITFFHRAIQRRPNVLPVRPVDRPFSSFALSEATINSDGETSLTELDAYTESVASRGTSKHAFGSQATVDVTFGHQQQEWRAAIISVFGPHILNRVAKKCARQGSHFHLNAISGARRQGHRSRLRHVACAPEAHIAGPSSQSFRSEAIQVGR